MSRVQRRPGVALPAGRLAGIRAGCGPAGRSARMSPAQGRQRDAALAAGQSGQARHGPRRRAGEEVMVVRGTQTWRAWAAALARRIGLEANPLRRGSDRLEAWIRIGLVLAFLAGAPIAGLEAARWARSSADRAATAQQASMHSVPATLLRNVPGASAYPYRTALNLGWVQARWTAPDGTVRTGSVQAPLGARAGSTVLVWTDRSGRLTNPPLQHSQIRGWVLMIGVIAPVLLALLLMVVLGICRQLLERRRMASWEQAWSAVEPHWTRRLR